VNKFDMFVLQSFWSLRKAAHVRMVTTVHHKTVLSIWSACGAHIKSSCVGQDCTGTV